MEFCERLKTSQRKQTIQEYYKEKKFLRQPTFIILNKSKISRPALPVQHANQIQEKERPQKTFANTI